MLVTKSSQLPQISSAKVCGFQVLEKPPSPRQLSSAPPASRSGSAQKAPSPRGRSWEVRGQVKVVLTLGHSFPTTWSSRGPALPAPGTCFPGQGQPCHPLTSHWRDLPGPTGGPDLGLRGREVPLSMSTSRLGPAPPHPLQPFPCLPPAAAGPLPAWVYASWFLTGLLMVTEPRALGTSKDGRLQMSELR